MEKRCSENSKKPYQSEDKILLCVDVLYIFSVLIHNYKVALKGNKIESFLPLMRSSGSQ